MGLMIIVMVQKLIRLNTVDQSTLISQVSHCARQEGQ
uniref:Uncharacterized protein n=1 Tax=Rhizophora mucronata TaxID=61149 RepID=A0A2P2NMB5_RHIMU